MYDCSQRHTHIWTRVLLRALVHIQYADAASFHCGMSVLVCVQLVANAVLFTSVNLSGVFVRILTERTQRKVFLQARSCIEERLRLEDENEKQVRREFTHKHAHNKKRTGGKNSKTTTWHPHISLHLEPRTLVKSSQPLEKFFVFKKRFQVPMYSNNLPTGTQ